MGHLVMSCFANFKVGEFRACHLVAILPTT